MKNEIKYLECHADRHDWDEIELNRTRKVMGYRRVDRCTECHGLRIVNYTQHGIVINRHYEMPKDYKGPVGMSRADYRKIWFDERLKKQRKLEVVS